MSDTPWIKFYASDWLAGTSGLTAAERGVYITIIALIYENDGGIAYDEKRLARRCGITKSAFVRAVDGLCDEGKLSLQNGVVSNRRAEKELSARDIRSQKASASAQERWRGHQPKIVENQRADNANASAKQCSEDANQNQNQKERDKSLSSAQTRVTRFDDFWAAYPHRNGAKKGRKAAETKYTAAIKSGATEADIIEAATRFQQDRQVLDGYAPDPATWLNQARWQDEIEPAKAANNVTSFRPNYGDTRERHGKREVWMGPDGWMREHG